MAQADKSKFLSKLARFVANPTTDWSALDRPPAGPKSGDSGSENQELSQAEIFAISYQRRKDNRNIRLKEFAMLRQVRAGASVPHAQSMPSHHTKQAAGAEQAEAAKVAAIQKPTLIADFNVNKINHIEQQMAEQWWDSVDKTKPLHTQIPIDREVAKTQVLIETQIAQFDMPDKLQDSDVIEFDPAMLEGLPVQPVAQAAAQAPVQTPVQTPVQPSAQTPARTAYQPTAQAQPVAQQAQQAYTAPVQPSPTAAVPAAPVQPVAQPVQAVAQPQAQAAAASQPVPVQSSLPASAQQAPLQPSMQAAPQSAVRHAPPAVEQQPSSAQHQQTPVAPVPQSPVPVPQAKQAQPAATPQAVPVVAGPTGSAAHAAAPPVSEPVSSPVAAAPVAMPASTTMQPAVQQGRQAPASPVHGSGEQVDFSADRHHEQPASTFVYRDAFTEFPQDDANSGSGASVDEELPLHPLTEADTRSMAEAQAVQDELYADPASLQAVAVPPEYTPEDLPECLNEPAILFVQGHLEQAEKHLLELAQAEQLRAQMGQNDEEPHVLLALLDFYRCTEQEEKFEAASIEMVRYFDRSAPQYQGADLGEATRILSTLGAFADIDYSVQNGWRCPADLDLTDVMLLRAQLMTQPPQVMLDWQMLRTMQDDAVEPLLDQFRDLAGRKIDLLMWGGEQLLACCVQKIEEQNGVASPLLSLLWLLRLELVRIMHGQEAFDHLALDYCVALEESPPSWARARCHFIDADNALSMLDGSKNDAGKAVERADAADLSKDEEVTLKHPLQWKGTFKGNIQTLLRAVSAESQGDFCVIDCSQFNGMDYPAAVALLEWLMEPQNVQRHIQFVQVNRLLAVFWRVMGITAQATVKLRRD